MIMNWKYNHPLKNGFTFLVCLFILVGTSVLLIWDKSTTFLLLNQQHSFIGDVALKYLTHVGDGLFMIGLGIVLLGLGKRKLGVLMLLTFLLSGLFVQLIKHTNPSPRPGLYFSKSEHIHCVDGNLLKGSNSFPSGHTTTAFALFALLAFATRNTFLQIACFLGALSIGYSRIYLGQHFLADVLTGAIVGTATAYLLTWLLRNKEWDS